MQRRAAAVTALSLKAWRTDTSSGHMMAVTMETWPTEEAASISERPVRAGLLTSESSPSRVTPPALARFGVTGFIISARWTLLLTSVSIITRRAGTVTPRPVPARFTFITGPISSRAELVVFTETTTHFTPAAICPGFTGLVAEQTLVPRLTHALPTYGITAAVCEITVASSVTAGSPPACLTVTHACALITR